MDGQPDAILSFTSCAFRVRNFTCGTRGRTSPPEPPVRHCERPSPREVGNCDVRSSYVFGLGIRRGPDAGSEPSTTGSDRGR